HERCLFVCALTRWPPVGIRRERRERPTALGAGTRPGSGAATRRDRRRKLSVLGAGWPDGRLFCRRLRGVDVFGGYSIMGDTDTTLPLGWLFSIAGKVNDSVGIVAEAGGGYKSYDLADVNLAKLSVHNFVTGPRFYIPAGSATVFSEVLGGLTVFSWQPVRRR